ncbi:MAG: S9 family peptidase [Planctomycetes bacterium]|nr:S9 family peptidase [Planctomycetota bacterium]
MHRSRARVCILAPLALVACATPDSAPPSERGEVEPMPIDPYLWLEEVSSERSLAWAREHNAKSERELVDEELRALEARLKAQYDSAAKIPTVQKIGAHYYNLWTDAQHPRGLWRRTTPAEYEKSEPAWETVLDIDALGQAEGQSWVWHGANVLAPEQRLCLISLSPGGSDAAVVREFDLATKRFVEGGFSLPEAKSSVDWRDQDHLWVGTDFGPGSLTESGYPRTARLWKRGTPLAEAPVVFEGRKEDVWVAVSHDATPGFERDFALRAPTFFTNETFLWKDGAWVKLAKPDDAQASAWREWLLIQTRSSWTVNGETFAAGSLLATKLADSLAGAASYELLFAPSERTSLAGFSSTKNHLILATLDNVKSRLAMLTPGERGWTRTAIPGLPEFGELGASAVDDHESDEYFLTVNDFLSPVRLHMGTLGAGAPRLLKSMPEFFDVRGLAVSQHEAISKDGTKIPYFEVRRKDLVLDGSAPTLLYAYGGFEISMTPSYNGSVGAAWLEQGGVYVLANIRGGGEFGPRWHQAALKQHRLRCYEDLAAVARDLSARKITSARHLGVMGGSNGGLMVGNMITLYPELFRAAVCQVPLLDMRRYHELLAGASWMGEYGNPDDPAEWAFISGFSPYHNVKQAGAYPRTLFMTSTKDDRVHPGHARKMVARMEEQGHDVLYYENLEGGHGGAADNGQRAFMAALSFRFLARELSGGKP